jgi:N-acetylglucosamine-1-phosphate uridyltransferase (contains nucleotidyltransferase and I-patch acetyltransferase domains)
MKKITTVILAAGKSTRFKHKKSKIFQDLAGI